MLKRDNEFYESVSVSKHACEYACRLVCARYIEQCVFVHVRVYALYTCVNTHLCAFYTCIRVQVPVCLCAFVHVCSCVYLYTRVHARVHLCLRMHTCKRVRTCVLSLGILVKTCVYTL